MATDPASDNLPTNLRGQVDALCDRFEEDWSAGRHPALEVYLAQAPETAQRQALRDLLEAELLHLKRIGRPLDSDSYRRRLSHLGPWVGPMLTELFALFNRTFRVTLAVTEGPNRGAAYTFADHDTFLVGRSPEAHFALPDDPYFSRMHFLIEVNPPLCRLLDLRSRNKTLVNGRAVEAADLVDGDEIRAGRTVLRVSIERPDVRPAAEATRAPPPPTLTDVPVGRTLTVAPVAPVAAPVVPAVPGYCIERKLGEGGMGVVWLACREVDGVPVAVKAIVPATSPDSLAVKRFLRETAILRKLQHPSIVGFREGGEAGGVLYFVMDYVPGTDAGRLLREQGPLPIRRAIAIVCRLLEALAYAHGLGFVHRDVKPSNLLVTEEEGRENAKLADFGLARMYQDSPLSGLTMTGAAGGTPAYMPPEQVLNFRHVQPTADQYAAAATLYTLLTGRAVHGLPAAPQEVFMRILLQDPDPVRTHRPEVPAALAEVMHRALARRPDDRFADVEAFRRELLPFGV